MLRLNDGDHRRIVDVCKREPGEVQGEPNEQNPLIARK